ncbi:hypothetical protein [Streptomyces sp. SPB162]|uniref:hypothetical protein n=1 Tax=Streptomyces sp. SPB162 TaxID=2940560 RepID=UPI0024069B5D|nr:hypothetical protein [Streptomyces sp. SPB162]MDF9814619.1 hypothetical protein [Streptomyces sp. SPB162]
MVDTKVTELIRVLVLSGGQGPPRDWARVCAQVLDVDGIAISVASEGTELLWFSDAESARLDDLQFTLGEGPSVEAARDGSLNLESNLERAFGERWPAFVPAAVDSGVLAVFAFPLRLGAICFGAMTGHRHRPGPLGEQAVADALTIADAMAVYLLALGPRETGPAVLATGTGTGHPAGRESAGDNGTRGFGTGFLTGFGGPAPRGGAPGGRDQQRPAGRAAAGGTGAVTRLRVRRGAAHPRRGPRHHQQPSVPAP